MVHTLVKYWYPEYRKNLSKLIRNTTQQKQWSKETNKNFTEEEERMDNKIDLHLFLWALKCHSSISSQHAFLYFGMY